MRLSFALISFLGVGLLPLSTASARPHRVDEIPNGDRFECLNCHLTQKGEHFSKFGSAVRSHLIGDGLEIKDKTVDWPALAGADADGDTWTNGEELGDPTGAWTPADPNPAAKVTNPGDKDSHPPGVCGNGILEPDEDCEGSELSTSACAELNLGEGTLTCGPNCHFDFAACSSSPEPAPSAAATDEPESCAFRPLATDSPIGGWRALWVLGAAAVWRIRRSGRVHR